MTSEQRHVVYLRIRSLEKDLHEIRKERGPLPYRENPDMETVIRREIGHLYRCINFIPYGYNDKIHYRELAKLLVGECLCCGRR